MIMSAEEEMMEWKDLKPILDALEKAIDDSDQDMLRKMLKKAVPGFKPKDEINDILFVA